MQTVAANLTQACFDDLDGPPVVVGSRNWITPAAELEAMFFPQPAWLLDAVHEQLLPLVGYRPTTNRTTGELLRRARLGAQASATVAGGPPCPRGSCRQCGAVRVLVVAGDLPGLPAPYRGECV